MAIYYDFFEVNELNKTQGKLRARAVSYGTVDTNTLVDWIRLTSGISAGEAKGFIAVLTDSILHYLKLGYNVEVGDLGFFSVSLTSKLVDKPGEIRAESIELSRVNYKPTRRVRIELINAEKKLVSGERKRRKVIVKPQPERAELLKGFLKKNGCISRVDYCRITALGREKAINDLNQFIAEGWLRKYGRARNVVYLLKQAEM